MSLEDLNNPVSESSVDTDHLTVEFLKTPLLIVPLQGLCAC